MSPQRVRTVSPRRPGADAGGRKRRFRGRHGALPPPFCAGLSETLYCGGYLPVADRLQPLAAGVFAGYFHGQMAEPAVLRRAVPVLHARGDVHHITGRERLRALSPRLIPAAPGDAQENLSAALVGAVNMPVVAASRSPSIRTVSSVSAARRSPVRP